MLTGKSRLAVLREWSVGQKLGLLRAVPVRLAKDGPFHLLLVYSADFDIDPYNEMFFFPTDTLKLQLVDPQGKTVWKRDLGKAVIPGIWFTPVYAFDLDRDGTDEIWFVNNIDRSHELSLNGQRLQKVDARTGQDADQWEWPMNGAQSMSATFRNFIFGGYCQGEPVLVTAQGTYGPMRLQGRKLDGSLRWEHEIEPSIPGARGSHMCAVADLDDDGVDEVMWGERCIEMGQGREIFCADRDTYKGHSDTAQPVMDTQSGKRFLYTCREGDQKVSPRVVMYDSQGKRVWGHVDQGHMDLGWVARIGENRAHVTMAIRMSGKVCGPDGRFRADVEEFTYDAATGKEHSLPFKAYGSIPVDINGDGFHELVYGLHDADFEVLDRHGRSLGNVGGPVAMASKFMDLPGEQILSYTADGTLRVWADESAEDCDEAQSRYAHPMYGANQRLTGVGYNLVNLGGV